MDRNDREAIEALFDKLATVERQSLPRDGESEALIRDKIVRQPGAPYYMAQTIVVQEQALAAAEARLADLEAQVAQTSGAKGGLFRQPIRRSAPAGALDRIDSAGAEQRSEAGRQRGGGGFLAGAAQTALGVTGGVLLGNAIAGMLGGHDAKATEQAEAKPAEPAADTQETQEEPQTEEADFADGGTDLGDFDVDL
jgi:hypothetical protein